MARTNITFNGYDLQSSNIIISEISHEDVEHKTLNIQRFSDKGGGKLGHIGFESKVITISGIVKGTSKSNLESNLDDLKKQLNAREKNLDIDYETGTRRYIATMNSISFERNSYTIDVIGFRASFIVNDPAWGTSLDTTTLEDLGLSGSSGGATGTLENIGYADYGGTIRPYPIIKITLNSVLGIRRISFENTNEDGFFSRTRIEKPASTKFQDGDVILIDTDEGTVTLNGSDVDFDDGFPQFSLSNNQWNAKVVGESYNIDVKIIYYKLWL